MFSAVLTKYCRIFFYVLPNADVMPGGIRHLKLRIYSAPSIHVIHSDCDLLLQSNQRHSPQIGADLQMSSLPAAAGFRRPAL